MSGRVKLDASGPIIAQPGHTWDENEEFLLFSPAAVAMEVYASGTVAMNSAIEGTSPPVSSWNSYHKTVVPFGKTFSVPPICFVQTSLDASAYPGADTGHELPIFGIVGVGFSGGDDYSQWRPWVFMEVTTTALNIWCAYDASLNVSHHYLVLENTIT